MFKSSSLGKEQLDDVTVGSNKINTKQIVRNSLNVHPHTAVCECVSSPMEWPSLLLCVSALASRGRSEEMSLGRLEPEENSHSTCRDWRQIPVRRRDCVMISWVNMGLIVCCSWGLLYDVQGQKMRKTAQDCYKHSSYLQSLGIVNQTNHNQYKNTTTPLPHI